MKPFLAPARCALLLFVLLLSTSAALSARPAKKPTAAAAAAAMPTNPGPPPVVLDGAVALPADIPPAPLLPDTSSYVLLDFATGAIIAAKAPDIHLPPASLAKLMTAYLTYEAVKAGKLKLDQQVPVSHAAWRTGGSRMFIEPNLPVTIEELVRGLVIDSGNDAAVALAETLAGTAEAFVAMMNNRAQLLHLADTHYDNVDGLPDPAIYTSSKDVALLSRAIIRQFPGILKISKEESFTYNNITQRNWNPVIFRDSSADGLKTGYVKDSGHCIDATAVRGGRRLIAVVMGTPNWHAGTADIEALFDYGYRFFRNDAVTTAGAPIGAIDDPLLDPTHVPVGAAKTVLLTLPASGNGAQKTDPAAVLNLRNGLQGPIAKGEVVGKVAITLQGKTIETVPAVALAAARPAGFAQRLMYRLKRLW
ncbi:MAG TPA: D-alanyl-D-alanine carboxypeptidase family protein [Stellaceae bacterium]|nr:D-alanyl-D-alanine carboxypeptidase family protein [Stellaceae bacterium]